MSHSAQLDVEQVNDELRTSVASRRQGVPGGRDDRDPKGVVYPAHLLLPPWGKPIIVVDLDRGYLAPDSPSRLT